MNTAETLRAAAARVRQAWTQGDYYNRETNGVCAVGAICVVSGVDLRSGRDVIRITDGDAVVALARAVGWPHDGYIHNWNDQEHMTAEDVARAMECAATIWEQEQRRENPIADFAEILSVESGKA